MNEIDPNNVMRLRPASGFSSLLSKELLYTIAAVWVAGMFAALVAFGTFRADAAPESLDYAMRCTVGFAVASVLIMAVNRLIAGKLWSRGMCITVGVLTAVMFAGIAVNLAGYLQVPGSTWAQPGLKEWSDARIVYVKAYDIYIGEHYPVFAPAAFIPLVILHIFGPGLLAPLLFNAGCMSLSSVLTGVICARLCNGADNVRRARVGALLFALIPSIPYYGTMLLKEAPLTLGVSLMTLMFVDVYNGRLRTSVVAGAVIGAILLMLERYYVGYALALGAVISFVHARRSVPGAFAVHFRALIVSLLICFLIVGVGKCLHYQDVSYYFQEEQADSANKAMLGYETVGKYSTFVGNYYGKSYIEKLLYLPFSAAAQYFPPFPWNYTRDAAFGAFVPVAHLSILWYMVGGLVLGYFALCIYRRRAAGGLGLWALFWLLCYLGIALMSGGTVARYYLCLMPVCVPLALRLLLCLRHGLVSQRAFYTYVSVYAVMLACGLTMAYQYLKA